MVAFQIIFGFICGVFLIMTPIPYFPYRAYQNIITILKERENVLFSLFYIFFAIIIGSIPILFIISAIENNITFGISFGVSMYALVLINLKYNK